MLLHYVQSCLVMYNVITLYCNVCEYWSPYSLIQHSFILWLLHFIMEIILFADLKLIVVHGTKEWVQVFSTCTCMKLIMDYIICTALIRFQMHPGSCNMA